MAPCVRKGDVLLFDYRVLHRGLANHSDDARPVAYMVYAAPGASDRHNFPSTSLVGSSDVVISL